jgi:hypothetical protein
MGVYHTAIAGSNRRPMVATAHAGKHTGRPIGVGLCNLDSASDASENTYSRRVLLTANHGTPSDHGGTARCVALVALDRFRVDEIRGR